VPTSQNRPPAPAAAIAPVGAPQPVQPGWHIAAWLSEGAGTAILIFGGLSAGVAIAAAIWRYIPRDVLTAKIFHDRCG
jgi:hypothetical protein